MTSLAISASIEPQKPASAPRASVSEASGVAFALPDEAAARVALAEGHATAPRQDAGSAFAVALQEANGTAQVAADPNAIAAKPSEPPGAPRKASEDEGEVGDPVPQGLATGSDPLQPPPVDLGAVPIPTGDAAIQAVSPPAVLIDVSAADATTGQPQATEVNGQGVGMNSGQASAPISAPGLDRGEGVGTTVRPAQSVIPSIVATATEQDADASLVGPDAPDAQSETIPDGDPTAPVKPGRDHLPPDHAIQARGFTLPPGLEKLAADAVKDGKTLPPTAADEASAKSGKPKAEASQTPGAAAELAKATHSQSTNPTQGEPPSEGAALLPADAMRSEAKDAPARAEPIKLDLPPGSTPAPTPGTPSLRAGELPQGGNAPSSHQSPPELPKAVPPSAVPVEIGLRALQGMREFQIRLDPAELGKVEVRLEIGEDKSVTAKVVVERVDTMQLLQRDAKTLERAFEQAGLKPSDGGIDITLRDPGQQARDGDGRGREAWDDVRPDRGSGEAEPLPQLQPMIRRVLHRGAVDLSI